MPPSYIRIRAVVWAYGRGQTDTQTCITMIHFGSSTTHAKCNYPGNPKLKLTNILKFEEHYSFTTVLQHIPVCVLVEKTTN